MAKITDTQMLSVEHLTGGYRNFRVKDISFQLNNGDFAGVIGPNGSGKSSLAYALMGHPKYQITQGLIELNGVDVTHDTPDKRARSGMFLSLQQPPASLAHLASFFLQHAFPSANATPDTIITDARNKVTFFICLPFRL